MWRDQYSQTNGGSAILNMISFLDRKKFDDMNEYSNNSSNIPLPILIQYHKMGFKLIPIGDDGVTPNVKRGLNSRRDS